MSVSESQTNAPIYKLVGQRQNTKPVLSMINVAGNNVYTQQNIPGTTPIYKCVGVSNDWKHYKIPASKKSWCGAEAYINKNKGKFIWLNNGSGRLYTGIYYGSLCK